MSSRRYLLLLLLLSSVSLQAGTPEWSRWRGPDGNGVHPQDVGLLPWPVAGPTELWRAQVGVGFSSLSVSQGCLFTLGNQGGRDTVYCLDADTGEVEWSHSYDCQLDPNLYEGGPSATPTVDGDLVYTLSKFGHLFCFVRTNGVIVWERNLVTDFELAKPTWGFAGSPLVDGNRLILNAGGHGAALNKLTGDIIWISNGNRCGYSSPVPIVTEGVAAVVMLSYRDVVATAVDDGRLLWSLFFRSSFDMNCPDPISFAGKVFVTSVSRPGRLLTVTNGVPTSKWDNSGIQTHLGAGVLMGDYLYAFHGDAERSTQLKCIDLRDGVEQWATSLSAGALMGADGKLIILAGDGRLLLVEATPDRYTRLSESRPFLSRCWTMPALEGDNLFLRNAAGEVAAFSLPIAAPPSLTVQYLAQANPVHLAWPSSATGFRLECKETLDSTSEWLPVDQMPEVNEDSYILEVPAAEAARFYRLRKL